MVFTLPSVISRKETDLSNDCTLGIITSPTTELVVALFFLPSVIFRKETNLNKDCTLGIITSTTTLLVVNLFFLPRCYLPQGD